MRSHGSRYACGHCKAVVRRIGKHTNQKHPGLPVKAEKVA